MAKWHRFVALPQPTCGQVGAVKYRGSVSQILIAYMDPKTKCEFLKKNHICHCRTSCYMLLESMNIHSVQCSDWHCRLITRGFWVRTSQPTGAFLCRVCMQIDGQIDRQQSSPHAYMGFFWVLRFYPTSPRLSPRFLLIIIVNNCLAPDQLKLASASYFMEMKIRV